MTCSRRRLGLGPWGKDDGVSAVLVSLIVVFILIPVAAVAVDMSSLYSNRRSMQNAADAASQAGAQQMWSRLSGQPGSVETIAENVAKANGVKISDSTFKCWVVTVSYPPNPQPPPVSPFPGISCSDFDSSTVGNTSTSAYNAVSVWTSGSISTIFAEALPGGGQASTTAWAEATAAVQGVDSSTLGYATFAECAYAPPDTKPHSDWSTFVPLLVTDSSGAVVLNTGVDAPTIPNAIGQRYVIWSVPNGTVSNVDQCGLSESFDGLICGVGPCPGTQPIDFPADGSGLDLGTESGTKVPLAQMDGYAACDSSVLANPSSNMDFNPCATIMPICTGPGALAKTIHCVTTGEFLLSPGLQDGNKSGDESCTFVTPGSKSDSICAEFLGKPMPVDGTPTGDPSSSDAVRVALVQ